MRTLDQSYPPNPLPQPPWLSKKQMPAAMLYDALTVCVSGSKDWCIAASWAKASAKVLGRTIRKLAVYNGYIHWSEQLAFSEAWFMMKAPLSERLAEQADTFDQERAKGQARFKPGQPNAFGRAVFVSWCQERRDPPAVVAERKATLNKRIAAGLHVPRSKFREPQAPLVRARQASASVTRNWELRA